MTQGFFVTGIDTDVGKTWIAAGLLVALQARGHTAVGMKPVACGCADTGEGPRNEDALVLMRHSSNPRPPYALINRYALLPPIAPHLAAGAAGVTIDIEDLSEDLHRLSALADQVIVEGAGGWCVPLNETRTMADLARAFGLPVVLVVGIRLGCLNHALLSSQAIVASGLEFAGWIANLTDPHALCIEENIESLRVRLPAPLLGVVPHLERFDSALIAASLDGLPGKTMEDSGS